MSVACRRLAASLLGLMYAAVLARPVLTLAAH
jgi:hypothetical protein